MMLIRFTLLFFFFFTAAGALNAQCPGCLTSLPSPMAADTIYLGSAPDGQVGAAYDQDISFRMPMTTTPVAVVDPTVPPGLPITEINIVSVTNLPPGISWEASKLQFLVATGDTDGCVKFCGIPTLADSFFVQVTVTANVFGIVQSTSFALAMYIEPASVTNQGFTMTGNVGCGQALVSFTNNVPSNGLSGFSYFWDFGNGATTTQENPAPQAYTQPGAYAVNYTATIDTSDYFLTAVTIVDTDCNDFNIPPADKPDLFIRVKSPQGSTIYTSPVASNVNLPHTFYLNLVLEAGNYSVEVADDELIGTEECGSVNFTQTTTGILTDGELKVLLNINHPIQTITSVDSVYVYPVPDAPILDFESQDFCQGGLAELTVINYTSSLQWYNDTLPIPGATGQLLMAEQSGLYWTQYTSEHGCVASSQAVEITFHPLPALPQFTNANNLLSVNPSILPASYSLQWYQNGSPISGATDLEYCLETEGSFEMGLEVTDLQTGCSNLYTHTETYDPDLECYSSTDELYSEKSALRLFPNPVSTELNLSIGEAPAGQVEIAVFNTLGQVVFRKQLSHPGGQFDQTASLEGLQGGWYIAAVRSEDGNWAVRAPFIKEN